MKAIEKDRVRRYETAHALALDVRRHLNDQPVLAGSPSGIYRARKMFRRHRAGFVAAAAVVVVLIVGVVGTSWALLRAVRAERQAATEAVEARRQTAIAEAVNGFLNNDLLDAAAPSAARGQGKDVTMRFGWNRNTLDRSQELWFKESPTRGPQDEFSNVRKRIGNFGVSGLFTTPTTEVLALSYDAYNLDQKFTRITAAHAFKAALRWAREVGFKSNPQSNQFRYQTLDDLVANRPSTFLLSMGNPPH